MLHRLIIRKLSFIFLLFTLVFSFNSCENPFIIKLLDPLAQEKGIVNPKGIKIKMILIAGGSFEMGDVKNEGFNDEIPVHTVTLSSFYMSKYEVTRAQYQAVMGKIPFMYDMYAVNGEVKGNHPVEYVNWYEAIVFCNKLSMAERLSPAYSVSNSTNPANWGAVPDGFNDIEAWDVVEVAGSNGYRLPTEAQWEYAAKGGNGSPGHYTYAGSDIANDVAWYLENNLGYGYPREVGKKKPNGLGLYDMSGNVWEWCWDWYGSYSSDSQTNPTGADSEYGHGRVYRGGSISDDEQYLHSTCRDNLYPSGRHHGIGFRVVRPADSSAADSALYTVTFDANGGSGTVQPMTVKDGGIITLPDGSGFSRTDYVFEGWSTDANGIGTIYTAGRTYMPVGSIIFYAIWDKREIIEELQLNNGWLALFEFKLPAGKTWGDYTKLTADYKIEDITTQIRARVYGNYVKEELDTVRIGTFFPDYGNPINIAVVGSWPGGSLGRWLMSNQFAGLESVEFIFRSFASPEPEDGAWFTVDYGKPGTSPAYPHAQWNGGVFTGGDNANPENAIDGRVPAASDAGPLYLALGLTWVTDSVVVSQIKNVKLVGVKGTDDVVGKPLYFKDGDNLYRAYAGQFSGGNGGNTNNGKPGWKIISGADKIAVIDYVRPPAIIQIKFDANYPNNDPKPDLNPVRMYPGDTLTNDNLSAPAFPPTPPTAHLAAWLFKGWYTAKTGGTKIAAFSGINGSIFNKDTTLYAQWEEVTFLFDMVYVPGGTFQMGDVKNEGPYYEKPVHTVTLSSFYMSRYEITQAHYWTVMGNNPSSFSSTSASDEVKWNLPVDKVSWFAAIVFCNKLSILEGLSPAYSISGSTNPTLWGTIPPYSNNDAWNAVEIVADSTGYRLPTEAQWEYAAKGGNGSPGNYTYSGSDNVDYVGWYYGNSSQTHEVGKKAPNVLGLYDMTGNVREWCWDWYSYDYYSDSPANDPMGPDFGNYRVLRGGSWSDSVEYWSLHTASRDESGTSTGNNNFGFRVVRP